MYSQYLPNISLDRIIISVNVQLIMQSDENEVVSATDCPSLFWD